MSTWRFHNSRGALLILWTFPAGCDGSAGPVQLAEAQGGPISGIVIAAAGTSSSGAAGIPPAGASGAAGIPPAGASGAAVAAGSIDSEQGGLAGEPSVLPSSWGEGCGQLAAVSSDLEGVACAQFDEVYLEGDTMCLCQGQWACAEQLSGNCLADDICPMVFLVQDQTASSPADCSYPWTPFSPCGNLNVWPDPDGVLLVYDPGNQSPSVLRRSPDCATGAFTIDTEADTIVLCDAACAAVQSNELARVFAVYPCADCL